MSRHDRAFAVVCATLTILVLGWPRAAHAEVPNTNALWVADKDQIHKLSPTGSPILSLVTPSPKSPRPIR